MPCRRHLPGIAIALVRISEELPTLNFTTESMRASFKKNRAGTSSCARLTMLLEIRWGRPNSGKRSQDFFLARIGPANGPSRVTLSSHDSSGGGAATPSASKRTMSTKRSRGSWKTTIGGRRGAEQEGERRVWAEAGGERGREGEREGMYCVFLRSMIWRIWRRFPAHSYCRQHLRGKLHRNIDSMFTGTC